MTKDYVAADTKEELKEQYAELSDTTLLLRVNEGAEELGGGYSVRLCTNSRALYPGTVETLAELGYGVEYLGQPDDLHEWLLFED